MQLMYSTAHQQIHCKESRHMKRCWEMCLIILNCEYLVMVQTVSFTEKKKRGKLGDRSELGVLLAHRNGTYRIITERT